ncbi:MAG: hypothetical protein A4E67_02007 [Syntrophaceae bacterium PtaB.Bin038]|nr:MAG: hypothetical protein A4E67_02007 [Syntrophaceae bacterium PtaB.Bin038]
MPGDPGGFLPAGAGGPDRRRRPCAGDPRKDRAGARSHGDRRKADPAGRFGGRLSVRSRPRAAPDLGDRGRGAGQGTTKPGEDRGDFPTGRGAGPGHPLHQRCEPLPAGRRPGASRGPLGQGRNGRGERLLRGEAGTRGALPSRAGGHGDPRRVVSVPRVGDPDARGRAGVRKGPRGHERRRGQLRRGPSAGRAGPRHRGADPLPPGRRAGRLRTAGRGGCGEGLPHAGNPPPCGRFRRRPGAARHRTVPGGVPAGEDPEPLRPVQPGHQVRDGSRKGPSAGLRGPGHGALRAHRRSGRKAGAGRAEGPQEGPDLFPLPGETGRARAPAFPPRGAHEGGGPGAGVARRAARLAAGGQPGHLLHPPGRDRDVSRGALRRDGPRQDGGPARA